ncbi:MAG: ThiF family adenylyltransferase [Thermoanaerobaculia bacterium]
MTREKYSRSILFPGIGEEGQKRIGDFSIVFVGVGAVGAAAAEMAVRAGIGRVTIIDRDVVEPSNLARQLLFDAEDAERIAPKADAAAARLAEIDPAARIRPVVADLDPGNARELLAKHDLIFDGSDNFETRLLASDASRALGLPYLYAACVGAEGRVALTVPGAPCLRCYLETLPPAGSGPTCDTAGVVPTLPPLVASIGMTEVIRFATGAASARGILTVNAWGDGVQTRRLFSSVRPSPACPVCVGRRFPALEGEGASELTKLCGRQSVQVSPAGRARPDFEALERRLAPLARVRRSPQLLNADLEGVSLTVFPDGRCVVRGTADPLRARTLYDRYIGG